jgi:hypothetical protein
MAANAPIEALTAEVTRLSGRIDRLTEMILGMGQALVVAEGVRMGLADARRPSHPARASARRPGHLRAVDGGQR